MTARTSRRAAHLAEMLVVGDPWVFGPARRGEPDVDQVDRLIRRATVAVRAQVLLPERLAQRIDHPPVERAVGNRHGQLE